MRVATGWFTVTIVPIAFGSAAATNSYSNTMWSVPWNTTTSSSCAPVNVFERSTTVDVSVDRSAANPIDFLKSISNEPVGSSMLTPALSVRLQPVDVTHAAQAAARRMETGLAEGSWEIDAETTDDGVRVLLMALEDILEAPEPLPSLHELHDALVAELVRRAD